MVDRRYEVEVVGNGVSLNLWDIRISDGQICR